jgi:glucose-1-phosphate thymidylyltransferase
MRASSSGCWATATKTASTAYQDRPGGIAEALGLAERFAADEPVLVMLADNIVEETFRSTVERFSSQGQGARILLSEENDPVHLRHLGVPQFDDDGRIRRILEKPEDPPSPYAVTGIYCYSPDVFQVIGNLVPSGRGELEITDVNNYYVERDQMEYDVLHGFWGDAGESIDAYYAVNDFVRQNGANKG